MLSQRQLSKLIAGTPIEALRRQWSAVAARARVLRAPPESKLRSDPDAAAHLPAGGALRAEDFLVLLHQLRATRCPGGAGEELEWARGALGIFRQLDIRGEREVKWADFAAFVLALDMPRAREDKDAEVAKQEADVVGPPRPRMYEPVAGAAVADGFGGPLARLQYLPPPAHKLAAVGTGKEAGAVHLGAPDHPPRVNGALRHHTAYKPHRVLAVCLVDDTRTVATGSTLDHVDERGKYSGEHYLSLWTLPGKKEGDDDRGPLLPSLVHRRETPTPQNALCYSPRNDFLFSGGMESGVLYEWTLDESRRSRLYGGNEGSKGPQRLVACRSLRVHVFGITCLVEFKRERQHNDLLVSGSIDGVVRVWDPKRWFDQKPDDVVPKDVSDDCAAKALPAWPNRAVELEPQANLAAQAAGPAVLVASSTHGFLFSAGRPSIKGDQAAGSAILCWRFDGSRFGARVHATLREHECQIKDLCEVASEDQLLSMDVLGSLVVWALPSLQPKQTLQLPGEDPSAFRIAPVTSGVERLAVGGPLLQMYACRVAAYKEPLVAAHYDPTMGAFTTASSQRVCVWAAASGCLTAQIAASVLLTKAQDHEELEEKPPTRKPVVKGRISQYEAPVPGVGGPPVDAKGASPPEVVCLRVASTGRRMCVGDDKGGVHVCMLPPGGHAPRRMRLLDPHAGPCSDFVYLDRANLVLSGGAADGTLAVADDGDLKGYQAEGRDVPGRSVRLRDVRFVSEAAAPGARDEEDDSFDTLSSGSFEPFSPARRLSSPARRLSSSPARRLSSSPARRPSGSPSRRASDSPSPARRGSSRRLSSPASPLRQPSMRSVDSPARSTASDRGRELLAKTSTAAFEILCCAADLHLNLAASLQRNGSSPAGPQLCVWDLEMFTLVGTCAPPAAAPTAAEARALEAAARRRRASGAGTPGEEPHAGARVTAVAFATPFPCLLGATSAGCVHVWRVPGCAWLATLETGLAEPCGFAVGAAATLDEDVQCVVAGGCEDGTVAVWALGADALDALDLERAPPARRRSYNPRRQAHVAVNWAELRRSRRLSQVDLRGAGSPGRDVRRWVPHTWRAHDRDAEIVAIQAIARPRALLTAAEDGLARVWTWDGILLGQLDANRPTGGRVPWRFEIASRSPAAALVGVRETLDRAKGLAGVLGGAAPRPKLMASAQQSLRTLRARAGTPEGLDDLAASRRRPSSKSLAEPVDPARALLQSKSAPALLRPGASWDEAREKGRFSVHRAAMRPREAPGSWDSVFATLADLEKASTLGVGKVRPRARALRPPARAAERRPATGKTWKTRDSMVPGLARLAPELTSVAATFLTVDPPEVRDRRARTAAPRPRAGPRPIGDVVRSRGAPVPRLSGRPPSAGRFDFPDHDPNPLARLTRLAHMGL